MKQRRIAASLIAVSLLYGVPAVAAPALAAPALAAPSAPAATASNSGPVTIGEFTIDPSVDLLKRLDIIAGDPDGNMRLGDQITRAEIAKIAVAAMGQGPAAAKALTAPLAFPDLKDHWARGFVAVARQLGIVSGYGDGTFRPGNPVTNAEALTMLMRATGLKPTGPWPAAYIDTARAKGILTDGLAKATPPDGKATRAAVFLLAERCFTIPKDDKGLNLLQRIFDNTPPKITVTATGVVNGSTTAAKVTLTITAPGAFAVRVNGLPVWPAAGVYTTTLSLNPGKNPIYILAEDELGNTAGQPFDIERK